MFPVKNGTYYVFVKKSSTQFDRKTKNKKAVYTVFPNVQNLFLLYLCSG